MLQNICAIVGECTDQLANCRKGSPRHKSMIVEYPSGLKTEEQATKSKGDSNIHNRQPGDQTASINSNLQRRRSLHSSYINPINVSKGDRETTQFYKAFYSTLSKSVLKDKSEATMVVKKTSKRTDVTEMVRVKLEQLRGKDQRFHNLNKLLGDPFFLIAVYESICKKPGNMTAGIDKKTMDGISFEYFEKLSVSLKEGSYQIKPARLVEIPKKDGGKRKLAIASPRDKIVQAALACILEGIWEPKFLDSSHGFRPKRSTHSALKLLRNIGSKYTWVIQGDISKCFDSIPHSIIMRRIKRIITCPNTLALILKNLRAGIKEPNGNIIKSDIGAAQGSVLSPILCNITLHEFDGYIERLKKRFDIGKTRRRNPI